jgi:hypothetical protein
VVSWGYERKYREKISIKARYSPLAFRDNLVNNEQKHKTVTPPPPTDSSRMPYFFFIITLTAVLAMAVQRNQGRHFL